MKCAFIAGTAAGVLVGMVTYAMVEPMLPQKAKKAVRRGRRAIAGHFFYIIFYILYLNIVLFLNLLYNKIKVRITI